MPRTSRIDYEKKTVTCMIKIYCSKLHSRAEGLCPNCEELRVYALKRLDSCRFGEKKPVCGKCTVHCYKPEMRENIIQVMRFAGPRMLFKHPILALRHLVDRVKL